MNKYKIQLMCGPLGMDFNLLSGEHYELASFPGLRPDFISAASWAEAWERGYYELGFALSKMEATIVDCRQCQVMEPVTPIPTIGNGETSVISNQWTGTAEWTGMAEWTGTAEWTNFSERLNNWHYCEAILKSDKVERDRTQWCRLLYIKVLLFTPLFQFVFQSSKLETFLIHSYLDFTGLDYWNSGMDYGIF